MKLLTLICLLFGASNALFAQLEVTIRNVKNDKGNIRVGVFQDEKDFLKTAVYGQIVKAEKDHITVTFTLPPGTYALSVIHDENKNEDLDKNFMGIPKEGFGFSNDAMGSFGPPSFEKASITVGTGKSTTSISLRYMQ